MFAFVKELQKKLVIEKACLMISSNNFCRLMLMLITTKIIDIDWVGE